MPVDAEMPEPAVASWRHDNASPAAYDRMDRFNRVTSFRWRKTASGGRDFYRVDLEYDRDSKITTATDTVRPGFCGTPRCQYYNFGVGSSDFLLAMASGLVYV